MTKVLYDVEAVSANIAYAVGSANTAIKTVDGGVTWQAMSVGLPEPLAADFVDADVGWVVGDKLSIRKTVDGGANWTTQGTTVKVLDVPLFDVHFIDAQVGWAVGEGCTFRTFNGGVLWETLETNGFEFWTQVHFVDANVGWRTSA